MRALIRHAERLLARLGLSRVPPQRIEQLEHQLGALLDLSLRPQHCDALVVDSEHPEIDGMEGIVFSKDRPMQLHALLGSYHELALKPCRLKVLYNSSAQAY